MAMTPTEVYLLGKLLTHVLGMAPELIALMQRDSKLTVEDLYPTPAAVLEQRILDRRAAEEEGITDAPEDP